MDINYKLILNDLTYGEHLFNLKSPEKFDEYKQMAFGFLNHKRKHVFEDEILKNYNNELTFEKLLEQGVERFVQGANKMKDGRMQKTWYDLESIEEIERQDELFDYFFTCKLRHISLLQIDAFLEYHLNYSFDSSKHDYFRFLTILLRQFQDKILSANIIETVKEWMKLNEKETELVGTEGKAKITGKIKRERDDKMTQLNQEQTALLIYCLRQTRIILKDEYLNNKEAGLAFSILTGFSPETIRQNLNKSEQARIATKKNVDALSKALKDLTHFIENEVEPES